MSNLIDGNKKMECAKLIKEIGVSAIEGIAAKVDEINEESKEAERPLDPFLLERLKGIRNDARYIYERSVELHKFVNIPKEFWEF